VVSLFNFSTGSYEDLDTSTLGTSDGVVTVNVTVDAARFVNDSDRAIRTRMSCKANGPVLVYPWQARFDQTVWTITH
jgi:hypothetical protein